MGIKTAWQEIIERRNKNIGFITRTGAFSEPNEAQKAAALAIETQNWSETRTSWSPHKWAPAAPGKKTWTTGPEYTTPVGHGINLKRTREPGGKLNGPEYQSAMHAYVVTPMDHYGILKAQGVDVSRYERKSLFKKIYDWFKRKIDNEYKPQPWLTKEFIEQFKIKE